MNLSNISSFISILAAILSVLVSFSYTRYTIFHLEYMEKRLLPIKSRANIIINTEGITSLAIVLLVIALLLTRNKILFIFLSTVIVIYVILIILFYVMGERQEKKTLIKFNYNGTKYVFINRIDSTTISALPETSYNQDKGNTNITLFQLSDLSNVNFYTEKSSQQSDQSNIPHKQKPNNMMSLDTFHELLMLKSMFDAGVINQEEFEAKKKQLLNL